MGDLAVRLGGRRQRAVLALLALAKGEVVSTERLIDDLWEEAPPAARQVIHSYVANLRRAMVEAGGSGVAIETRPPGYRLDMAECDLDLRTVESLLDEARRKRADADGRGASKAYVAALAAWRGEALSDMTGLPGIDHLRDRLAAIREGALEQRIAIDIELGRSRELIPELRQLVHEQPFRETLVAHLMTALYRTGRQAEALETYRAARSALDAELGIEPGEELRRLEIAILRQDPALAVDLSAGPGGAIDAAGPQANNLPDPRRSSWRRVPVQLGGRAVVGLTALAAALTIAIGVATSPGAPAAGGTVGIHELVEIDPTTLAIRRTTAVGRGSDAVAAAGSRLWVTAREDQTIVAVDPSTAARDMVVGLGSTPTAVVGLGDRLLVANGFSGMVSTVRADGGLVIGPVAPRAGVAGGLSMAPDGDLVWIAFRDRSVALWDPRAGHVTTQVGGVASANAIAFFGGDVWLIGEDRPVLQRVRPDTGTTTERQLRGIPVAIAVGESSVWVATTQDNRLWRIDPATGEILDTLALPDAANALAIGAGRIWVSTGVAGVIYRVLPSPLKIDGRVLIGHDLGDLLVDGTSLWVVVR